MGSVVDGTDRIVVETNGDFLAGFTLGSQYHLLGYHTPVYSNQVQLTIVVALGTNSMPQILCTVQPHWTSPLLRQW